MSELPLVSICCIAYNQSHYIRDALEGFLMQKTNFAFEVLIHDDASTDGTEQIIREYEAKYPEIIKALYEEENQWVKGRRGSSVFNYQRALGKYIALCEGDDYWTDPLKLQKQVDFLEANPECGLVHTAYSVLNEETGRVLPKPFVAKDGDVYPSFTELLQKNSIATLTVMVRRGLIKEVWQDMDVWFDERLRRDYSTWLGVARYAKIGYIAEYTAVYRRSPGSVSNNLEAYKRFTFDKKGLEIKLAFIKHYNLDAETTETITSAYFDRRMAWMLVYNSELAFARPYVQSYRPKSFVNILFRALFLSAMPSWFLRLVGKVCFEILNLYNCFRPGKRGIFLKPY